MDSEQRNENAAKVNRRLLYKVLKSRNIEQVKILINGGFSVNTILDGTITLLCLAIETGNIELSKYLLDKGADINSSFGVRISILLLAKTPLHVAILEEKDEIIKYLLDKGANVNSICINCEIEPPLHLAVRLRNLKVIKNLINRGAYVNAVFENKTPLHLAISLDHEETVENKNKVAKYLIRKGANVNFASENKTPIYLAVERNNIKLIKRLLSKGASLNVFDDKLSPLHLAVNNNNLKVVKFFLSKRVNVNSICDNKTPLHLALCNNNNKVVKLLLKNGPDIDVICDNKTPLSLAIIRKNLTSVRYLVQRGANVNLISDGITPLQLAINSKSLELVKFLIENGADLTAICDREILHGVAACSNPFEIAQYLLEKNSDDSTSDKRSLIPVAAHNYMLRAVRSLSNNFTGVNSIDLEKSPLYLEFKNDPLRLAHFLVTNCEYRDIDWGQLDQNILLRLAVYRYYNSMARFIMKRDATFNTTEILHVAIQYDNLEILVDLIGQGRVNVNNSYDNRTLLFHALKAGSLRIVEFLIDNKADISYICSNMSCLQITMANERIEPATVKYLMIAGYDVNMEDENKKVAADYLERYSHRHHFVQIVQEHIIKLIAANLYVCSKNKKVTLAHKKYDLLYREYAEEVNLMKLDEASITFDVKVTCYDLLRKSIHKSALRFKHLFQNRFCSFEKPSIPSQILSKLDHYRSIVEFRLVKALERAELLVKVDDFFVGIARHLVLDPEVMREIVEYFSNQELKLISDFL
ncbi:uncharacterized protein LOC141526808 [Cotesia typhae]|uniref:uncharacterized protein LOC141526808 n=1 Tax=Cotesia typhae TaxID=2053667 RepID=UPI003D6982FE